LLLTSLLLIAVPDVRRLGTAPRSRPDAKGSTSGRQPRACVATEPACWGALRVPRCGRRSRAARKAPNQDRPGGEFGRFLCLTTYCNVSGDSAIQRYRWRSTAAAGWRRGSTAGPESVAHHQVILQLGARVLTGSAGATGRRLVCPNCTPWCVRCAAAARTCPAPMAASTTALRTPLREDASEDARTASRLLPSISS